jgi:glycosyltransferase involved in cell wall biosynthesis
MIALLGRPDTPTDGVDDYCSFLGQAVARRGLTLTRVHVAWNNEGWIRGLRRLWRDSANWRGQWILLQYTSLSWSRRGFAWGVLAAAAILRRRGARCAVVFHEATGFGGLRVLERVRHALQIWILRMLHRQSERSIFTAPLDTVDWLPPVRAEHGDPSDRKRSVFIPIGANIPECLDSRSQPSSLDQEKRIIIFSFSGAQTVGLEIADIASVAKEASKAIPNLRFVALGRGSNEVREDLANALEGCSVGLEVRGVLPAEEITRELRRADALLFVRGLVVLERGAAIAGIACGLPIVGYGIGEPSGPLAEAGVEWSTWRDPKSLARSLVRVLTDSRLWTELHERNVRAYEKYFSWDRIAELYMQALAE